MEPTWLPSRKPITYPSLTKSAAADVCVIGGGITGILCAYRLAAAGRRVLVLEAHRIGSDATAKTTAFITQAIDTDPEELSSLFGQATAKNVWDSGAAAIDEFERIIKKERLSCQFMRCPAIIYPGSVEQKRDVRQFVSALGRLGYKGTMDEDCFILPRQAKFHPIQFLEGMARRMAKWARKVKIHENTKATDIKEDHGRIIITTESGHEVTCSDVVIATYEPLGNPWDTFLKKGMYKTFVMEIAVRRNPRPEGIYWDLSNPYHYYRVDRMDKGTDRIILGGADHKAILPLDEAKQFELLTNHLEEVLHVTDYEKVSQWSGPILEPTDGLPLIGRYKPHHYVATAFSGNGMTYAMIASMIITDQIMEVENPYASTYNPERMPTIKQLAQKAEDYIEELGTAVIKPRTKKAKRID